MVGPVFLVPASPVRAKVFVTDRKPTGPTVARQNPGKGNSSRCASLALPHVPPAERFFLE